MKYRATNKGRELFQKLLPSMVTTFDVDEAVGYCSRICSLAKTYGGLAETACDRMLEPREEALDKRLEELITEYVHALPHNGVAFEPVFSGDPRGATVKIRCPDGRYDDWGQVGIYVPGS